MRRLKQLKIGSRVRTIKYGRGTVVKFEVLGIRKAHYVDKYEHSNSRIVIQLDEPDNWPGQKYSSSPPHFLPRDIQ